MAAIEQFVRFIMLNLWENTISKIFVSNINNFLLLKLCVTEFIVFMCENYLYIHNKPVIFQLKTSVCFLITPILKCNEHKSHESEAQKVY